MADRLQISWVEFEIPAQDPVSITSGLGALTLTGYEPTVDGPVNRTANPGAGELALTGFGPTVSTAYVIGTGVGALELTGVAPLVENSGDQRLRVSWVQLQTPAASPVSITTGLGALEVTGYAPLASIGGVSPNIVAGFGELTITGHVPTAVVFDVERLRVSWVQLQTPAAQGHSITTGLGALTITGHAPLLNESAYSIPTGVGELTLTGYAPEQTLTLPSPLPGTLTLTGYAPSLDTGFSPGVGALVLTGKNASADMTPPPNVTVTSSEADLLLTGYAPDVRNDITIAAGLGALEFVGYAPSIDSQIIVDVGTLEFAGLAPTIVTTEHHFRTPDVGELSLDGQEPTPMHGGAWSVDGDYGELSIGGLSPYVVNTSDQVVAQNPGGWLWNPPKRTKKQIDEERERLGVLPRTVQKALTRAANLVVKKVATDEEAVDLAQQIIEQESIAQVQAAAKAEIERAQLRWKANYEFVVQALILKALQDERIRQAEAEALRLQAEAEAQEMAEIEEISHIFLNWL